MAMRVRFFISLGDERHLPRIDCRTSGLRGPPAVIVIGIETADQLVELQGGLPDFAQQGAARAGAGYSAAAIHGGVIPFVPGTTALELPGSDFQTCSHCRDGGESKAYCIPRPAPAARYNPE